MGLLPGADLLLLGDSVVSRDYYADILGAEGADARTLGLLQGVILDTGAGTAGAIGGVALSYRRGKLVKTVDGGGEKVVDLRQVMAEYQRKIEKGDLDGAWETLRRNGLAPNSAGTALTVLNKTCFVADTPILTPDGYKPIQDFKSGDAILSRPENQPEAPVRPSVVEEFFELAAPILEVRLGGQSIETTAEHPFYVAEKGWVRAENLEVGDMLVGHDDQLTAVESLTTTDRHETVYNVRVAKDQTYFVGDEDWGFSVWVHNAYSIIRRADGTWDVLDGAGDVVRTGLTGDAAYAIAKNANGLADALKRFPNARSMDIRGFKPPAGGRQFADPDKLRDLGKFDWDELKDPILARRLPDGSFEIFDGMTRIEAAIRAGIYYLPVEIIN